MGRVLAADNHIIRFVPKLASCRWRRAIDGSIPRSNDKNVRDCYLDRINNYRVTLIAIYEIGYQKCGREENNTRPDTDSGKGTCGCKIISASDNQASASFYTDYPGSTLLHVQAWLEKNSESCQFLAPGSMCSSFCISGSRICGL